MEVDETLQKEIVAYQKSKEQKLTKLETAEEKRQKKEEKQLILSLVLAFLLRKSKVSYVGYYAILDAIVKTHVDNYRPVFVQQQIAEGNRNLVKENWSKTISGITTELGMDQTLNNAWHADNIEQIKESSYYRMARYVANAYLATSTLQAVQKALKTTNYQNQSVIQSIGDIVPDENIRIYDLIRTGKITTAKRGFKINGGDGRWNYHMWQAYTLTDFPCYGVDGEVVKVGDSFSNGLTSPKVHRNCLPKGTKIFAKRGLVDIEDITIDDLVLSMTDNRTIEFVKVKNIFSEKSSQLYSWKTYDFDFECTPDHRLVTISESDFLSGKNKLKFQVAKAIGADEYINIPQTIINNNKKAEFSDDELKFWAVYLARGMYVKGSNVHYIHIRVRNLSEVEKTEIYDLLKRLFPKSTILREGTIRAKTIEVIEKNGGIWSKLFHENGDIKADYMSLSKEQAGYIIKQYIAVYGNDIMLTLSSQKYLLELQVICQLAGLSTSYVHKGKSSVVFTKVSENYSVHNAYREIKEGNFEVFGIELEKNHRLLSAKDGRLTWNGNCYCNVTPVYRP